jgi:hypothetical protein
VTPRGRNTVQQARNNLREQGLIRDDTARSVGSWAKRQFALQGAWPAAQTS